MVKLKKGSKRQELARKYNIQRMVSAHKKKARKLKNKGELTLTRRKPPQIPNCIFKKEVLENIKRTKRITDAHAMEKKEQHTS
ncbi:GNL3L Grn1 [Babesia ovis]|uniref:GNL3L Grn1 n=1 Tax=Babesia ovis TaxID=5869 RepID=A0A9W5TAV8_BABOV|nr:GNL3L Grn1 [Babesia ovis]